MAIGALAACGGGSDSESSSSDSGSKKPSKIVIWEDTEKAETTKAAAKAFEEKEGVKVEVKEVKMTDQQKKVALDGPAGKGPDIMLLPHDQIGTVVDQGLIAELKDGEKALEPFIDTAKSAVTFDGKVYGYPKAVETPILFFNKDELKEAPASMDDLYKISTEQKKDGKYGFLALWDNFYFAHGPIGGYGGYVFKDNGGKLDPADIGLNNKGAVEGMDYIGKWYKEGLFPKGLIGGGGGQALDQLFGDKKAVAVMNGPWAVASYKEKGINLGASALPKLPNGEPIKTFVGVKRSSWHHSLVKRTRKQCSKNTMRSHQSLRFKKMQQSRITKSQQQSSHNHKTVCQCRTSLRWVKFGNQWQQHSSLLQQTSKMHKNQLMMLSNKSSNKSKLTINKRKWNA